MVKNINFLLIKNKLNTVNFRLNIYSVKNGQPDTAIINQNIVLKVSPDIGWKSVNLSPYNIRLKGYRKIAIGLEILNNSSDSIKYSYLIPSFPSPSKKSFYREKPFSNWNIASNSYLYVNIGAVSVKPTVANKEEDGHNEAHHQLILGNNVKNGGFCQVDSGKIYYEVYGEGEPLILLHGNRESIISFREQVFTFSKYFKVIAIDSRGQGNSLDHSTGRYTYELFSKDVLTVMDSLNIKSARILGWSDGGIVGIILASNHSHRISKLVTMGANIFHGPKAIAEEVIEDFERKKIAINESSSSKTNKTDVSLIDLVLNEPNLSPKDLNNIQGIPTLIIAGENDIIKPEHTDLIKNSIPGAKLSIIKDADHYAPLKSPNFFTNVVLDFLR